MFNVSLFTLEAHSVIEKYGLNSDFNSSGFDKDNLIIFTPKDGENPKAFIASLVGFDVSSGGMTHIQAIVHLCPGPPNNIWSHSCYRIDDSFL